MATLQGTCQKTWDGESWKWHLNTTVSFYYDGRFKKKVLTTRSLSHEHYSSSESKGEMSTRLTQILATDTENLEGIKASEEFRQALPAKTDPNKDLVPMAELCLLVPGTPVEVSNFILKFLEANKPLKKG